MTKPDPPSQAPRKWLKGCAVFLLLGAGLFAWAFWQIGEPSRRAQAVHQAIHPGMSLPEMEKLLTGRYYRVYQIERNGQWEIVTSEVFDQELARTPPSGPVHARIMLTFMGMSPGRVSFTVDIDNTGRISAVGKPKGWD